jgi:hypothetical protein
MSKRPSPLFDRLKGYAIRFGLAQPDPITWHEEQARASRAAYQVAERGVDIRPLIPYLHFHFTNGNYASEIPRTLARAGTEGIALLTNLVITGDRRVRDEAGWGLHFVAQEPMAFEALIRSANTETDPSLRANALGYLRRSKGPPEILVPLGLQFMSSDDAYARWQAASFLARYMQIDEARKALEKATNDPDQRVRSTAASAMNQKR